jgi:hypothetical protein
VAIKGEGARIHVGVIAQEVIAAFEAEGLDPMRYGVICYDEWPDDYENVTEAVTFTNEDGEETTEYRATGETKLVQPGGTIYGVRYEELLAFVLAAL